MYDSNVYYNPEAFGLKVVGMVEHEPNWDFDMLVVWESEDGLLYMASDSGCSCPSPFESYNSIEELERIGSYDQFVRALDEFRGRGYGREPSVASVDSLRRKVRRRLART